MIPRSGFHCKGRLRPARWVFRYLSSYGYPEKDYLQTDGVVEGVWIFTRHGDRVPGRCLSPEHKVDDEAAFWMTRMPCSPDSAAAFESFSKCFPIDIHPGFNQGKFIDTSKNPFGFLTQSGLEQLNENGRKIFDRYNKHGHHFPDMKEWRRGVAADFLSVWDVSAYSTNYLRTILSVQSFLDGLLGTGLLKIGETLREFDSKVTKERRVPNHSWKSSCETPLVKIQVRDVSNDPLNAFDRNPDIIADLVAEVMKCEEFFKRDSSAAPLAARLANYIPGLARRNVKDFSTLSPSGINWIEAADHFICRAAHGVRLSKFTEFEHDDQVEQTLAAMAHQTLTHLAWRFRQWYKNKKLLAVIAAPPLREIADQIAATPDLRGRQKHPFVVYSCHDITILGLLYGIGADFLADDEKSQWRFWPKYGSHLIFELVRISDYEDMDPAEYDSAYVVRVLLNGNPVITANSEKSPSGRTKLVYTGNGPEHMLLLKDFLKVVDTLETEGGYDYSSLLGRQNLI
jgi:hypothetical protein